MYSITFVTETAKYQVSPDTIADIVTTNNITYKHCRIVGLDSIGRCLRVVTVSDGIAAIPLNLIKSISESNPDPHIKLITVSKR